MVIDSRNNHPLIFLSRFFRCASDIRAKENRQIEAFKCASGHDALKVPGFMRCVEIGRFMPELIDSPRYYELYDFYEKSVLTTLHSSYVRIVSFFLWYDLPFDIVARVLRCDSDWRTFYRGYAAADIDNTSVHAYINNAPCDFYRRSKSDLFCKIHGG